MTVFLVCYDTMLITNNILITGTLSGSNFNSLCFVQGMSRPIRL